MDTPLYTLTCPYCKKPAICLVRKVRSDEVISPSDFRHVDGRPALATELMVCDSCGETISPLLDPFPSQLWRMIVAAGADADPV